MRHRCTIAQHCSYDDCYDQTYGLFPCLPVKIYLPKTNNQRPLNAAVRELPWVVNAQDRPGSWAMPFELKKIEPISLRAAGLDEKWLQDRILEDPTILRLGQLDVLSKERRQPQGGRIDFLMYAQEEETYYEVEVMLGSLDESHIIRTIEYWDTERQRRPAAEHRPVIVAEQITSRFFNVLRLFNRAVPMIAVQLEAFKIDENSIALHAVTVLDVTEEAPEDYVTEEAQADRKYWDQKVNPASLAIMDRIVAALKSDGLVERLTYNKGHIALGSTGNNFCWFHPRQSEYCHIEFRLSPEIRDEFLTILQNAGIDAASKRTDYITFNVRKPVLDERLEPIVEALKKAEVLSR